MTDFNKPRPTPEDEAFLEIERQQARQQVVRVNAAFEALYPNWKRNQTIEEVALHIEKLKGFGQDTVSSLAVYIREMKK
jgi:hypothetical protein